MMDALEQARREIDTVDAQLAALFERRMKAVLSVAEYKKAHGLPIFDAAREKVVLDKAEARIGDPALRPYYRDHVQNMMDVAKQYEAQVLGRAAYQGVEGAFAHIALRALFPHAEAVSCPTWDEVFDAVEKGDAAHGVVPFENSHAGDVSAVLDLCYNHPGLWVVAARHPAFRPDPCVQPPAGHCPERDLPEAVRPARHGHAQHGHGGKVCGRERRPDQGGHCQRGDRRPVRAGGAGAQHQHRR